MYNSIDRLGQILRRFDAVGERELAHALKEQDRSGGRLGEILVASGALAPADLKSALAEQFGVPELGPEHEPLPHLPSDEARALRAVAVTKRNGRPNGNGENGNGKNGSTGNKNGNGAIAVAFSDPSAEAHAAVAQRLRGPITPKVATEEELDSLLATAYAEHDAAELHGELRNTKPQLSAATNRLSRAQLAIGAVVALIAIVSAVINPMLPLIEFAALGTAFFIIFPSYRFYISWQAVKGDSTIAIDAAQLASLDAQSLPLYTVLLPLYGEKRATVESLFGALDRLNYPKHKLDVIALVELDDEQTRSAIDAIGAPPWIRVLEVPDEGPRTKPKALMHGLRNARGGYLTVYDAEDRPEPDQLLAAVWAYRHTAPEVACLQAKLNYYNARQNTLTRWCTLEYDAWFDMTMPGLHRTGAPIPLGGTSNHFRTDLLRECDGWDPYNVTEDADLGLRFARLGYETKMLESTTWEEAPSRLAVWMRQRSRWIKGYMQTFLVHTRDPRSLRADLGTKNMLAALLIVGGSVLTTLLSAVFVGLMMLWLLTDSPLIAGMFPVPIYYFGLISLVLGNFLLILLSAASAVAKRQDDLIGHAIMIPAYWLLMSVAGYMALWELISRPHFWHKTEHGLIGYGPDAAPAMAVGPEAKEPA